MEEVLECQLVNYIARMLKIVIINPDWNLLTAATLKRMGFKYGYSWK
jgi:hypothetical protein